MKMMKAEHIRCLFESMKPLASALTGHVGHSDPKAACVLAEQASSEQSLGFGLLSHTAWSALVMHHE